jgi:ADP-heptose:LPS heptosyltransferase
LRYGWFSEVLAYRRGLRAGFRLFKVLRNQDQAIFLDQGQRGANLAWLAGVRRRAGAKTRKSRHLTHLADLSGWNEHVHYQSENMVEIIRRSLGLDLGAITDINNLEIPAFSLDEKKAVARLIREHGLNPEQLLLLAPFTAVHHREWPLANYQELIFRLGRELGVKPVVVGSAAERDVTLARSLQDCVNLTGKTTFMEMAVLISRARLLVGSCSGHAHLAAALRRPAVILYGPSHPVRYANPVWTSAVSLGLACMGCVDRSGNKAVCAERPCLAKLPVEAVFNACRLQWTGNIPAKQAPVG